jgi:hypothetical protein
MLDFLKSEAKVSGSSQAMMASRSYYGYGQQAPTQMMGVHAAAYFGLREEIAALVEIGCDPDCKDRNDRTPLSWAAERGHVAVVRLLVENDADLKFKDDYDQTPLLVCGGERARGGGTAAAGGRRRPGVQGQ